MLQRRRGSALATCSSRASSITPPSATPVEVGERDVALDVVDQDQAERLAVLGDVGEAGVDRLVDRVERRPACRPSSAVAA